MAPRKEKDDVEKKKTRRKPTATAAKAKTSRRVSTKATKATKATTKTSRKAPSKTLSKTPSRTRKPVVKTPKFNETEGEFYKVFAQHPSLPNTLRSPSVNGIFALDYPIGERTFAREEMVNAGYGIMIFKNIEDAKNWTSYSPIFKVRVGRVFDVPERRLHRNVYRYTSQAFGGEYIFVNKEGVEISWREVVANLLSRSDVVNNWPRGSVMTDWVIPVERIR